MKDLARKRWNQVGTGSSPPDSQTLSSQEESHGMLGGRHLQVREGEPESMWTSREKSSPCFQQRSELWWVAQVQRGRDLGFVITTMVVLMTIFSKK